MNRLPIILGLLRLPLDYTAFIVSAFLAYFLRPYTDLIPFVQIPFDQAQLMPFGQFAEFVFIAGFGFLVFSAFNKLYNFVNTEGRFWELFQIILSVFYLVLAIVAFYAVFKVETFFSRGVLLQIAMFTVFFSFFFRMILRQVERILLKRGIGVRKIALFGVSEMREKIMKEIEKSLHYKVVFSADSFDVNVKNEKTLNFELSTFNFPDEVWFIKTAGNDQGRSILEFAQVNHLLYRFVPDVFGTLHAKMEEGTIGHYPLLTVHPTPLDGWGRVWKRAFDLVFSLIALVFLAPFFLVLAVLIKLDSKGPVFYVSHRVGKNGQVFPMFKFRSMVINADELKARLEAMNHRKDTPLFKIKNDPRITPFGRFLRRFSIDELPQIFNVLLGTMSIVGPRAHLPNEVEKYSLDQRRVLTIKPGITGLPQVSGRSDLNFEDEIRLDLHYITQWSLLLDLKIIWRTPFVLLKGQGAD